MPPEIIDLDKQLFNPSQTIEASMQYPLITAIIPIRLSEDKLYDEVERISRIVKTLPPSICPLVVDYGTSDIRRHEIENLCISLSCKYVREDTSDRPFSVGHARDIGAQYATTPLVMFHDIDFLLSREGYESLIHEAEIRNMPNNAYAFYAVPGAYLTENYSKEYLSLHEMGRGKYADTIVHDAIMRNDKSIVEQYTFAISAIVVNRLHLLAIGGHDRSFTGHGAEDYELMHRLSSYYMKGPRTKNYYKNTRSNSIQTFEGFRAFYALYGIDVFQRGIVISHLWHPRRIGNGYTGTGNQDRVSTAMKNFDAGITFIPPLNDLTSNEVTLVLIQVGTSPYKALRHILPILGNVRCIQETEFVDQNYLLEYVETERIQRIFFLNPYGNPHRLLLYKAAKAAGIHTVAYDRGAINDAWFFDTKGFLGESKSYDSEYWDRPLTPEEAQATREYINRMRTSSATLEVNGPSIGAEQLKVSLGIGDRKVLFVALQRPSDTATVYFSGACGSAAGFNEWISYLASKIDGRHYVVVAKRHPLETSSPILPNVMFVPDDTHINDLIELSDKVIVINSGSGLIAASYGKPVVCCGQSFYAHPGVAFQANNKEELLNLATSKLTIDTTKMLRFMRYLIFDFYSFGKTHYISSPQADGSLRKITNKIIFSSVRGLTDQPIEFGDLPKGVSLDAPLFYSFGGRSGITGAAPRVATSNANITKPSTVVIDKKGFLNWRHRLAVPLISWIYRLRGRSDLADQLRKNPALFAKQHWLDRRPKLFWLAYGRAV